MAMCAYGDNASKDTMSEEVPQVLARRIWRTHASPSASALTRLPSVRDLSDEFGVTRHAIVRALEVLESSGSVKRIARSGSFIQPLSTSSRPDTLPCINVIDPPSISREDMQWLQRDYLSGYTEALEQRPSVKMRFCTCADDVNDYSSLLWPRAAPEAQACILVNRRFPALFKWLHDNSIPFVSQCGYHYNCEGLPDHHKVYVNKAGGAFDGTRHLLSLGHRRIGFVGQTPGTAGASPVYEGYHAALRLAGLDVDPQLALCCVMDSVPQDIGPIVGLLKHPRRPSAIVARNDFTALTVLIAARSIGIRVPEHLSVLGMNDQAEAVTADPALTTIAVPRRQLGRTCMETLLGAAEGAFTGWQTRVLDCRLVVRKSTAPPGGA